MALFTKSSSTTAYLKCGLLGFAGAGKTYTATVMAVGLIKHIEAKGQKIQPIYFLDSETGSDWVEPMIRKAGIELLTAKTRAFKDLCEAVPEAEKGSSVLLIDSISHFWKELCETYMRKKGRQRLEFQDWAFLKTEWSKFTDAFVNSRVHIILCGRAGYEYDWIENEDTGKKDLQKTGVKMKAETEMGYEPSLLVLMERELDMKTMIVKRYARVLKDRSTLLDGKEFPNPTFEDFLPHIQCLNLGGTQLGVDTTRNSADTIPADIRDTQRMQRKILIDEIQSALTFHYPGQSAAEKKTKIGLVRKHFNASWTEVEEVMPLAKLKEGYKTLQAELEGQISESSDDSHQVSEVVTV